MWTATLVEAVVDPQNAHAVRVTIEYANKDTGESGQQVLNLADPERVSSIAAEWIAQRIKIASYAAAPPLGPVDIAIPDDARADRLRNLSQAARILKALTTIGKSDDSACVDALTLLQAADASDVAAILGR